MDEVNDQVQQDSLESPDQVSAEQSETTTEQEESNLFELPDGRKLAGDELKDEYLKLNSEFTRRSQKLTELEKERMKWEDSAQQEAAKAVSENDYLKDVDPNVREAIVQIVTPVIEDSLKRRDAEAQKRAQDEAFTKRLDELKTKYPGGNGLPKFDEVKVLAAMQDPNNSIFDPEAKFKELNEATFIDYYVKQAIKGKSSDTKTESTTGGQPKKPQGKTPKTWEDAAKSAFSRVTG